MTEKPAPQTPEKAVYRRITDHFTAAIEAGAGSWKLHWHNDAGGIPPPVNASTGKAYRGVNLISLWATAQEKAYDTPQWATYKQWA